MSWDQCYAIGFLFKKALEKRQSKPLLDRTSFINALIYKATLSFFKNSFPLFSLLLIPKLTIKGIKLLKPHNAHVLQEVFTRMLEKHSQNLHFLLQKIAVLTSQIITFWRVFQFEIASLIGNKRAFFKVFKQKLNVVLLFLKK